MNRTMTLYEALAFVRVYGDTQYLSPKTRTLLETANEIIEAAANRVYRELRS